MLQPALMLVAMAAVFLLAFYTTRLRVPPVPSFLAVRRVAVGLLKAHCTAKGRPFEVVELGCGWGGMVACLGRAFPGARITACEAAWLPYLVCRARFALNPHVRIIRQNLFCTPLAGADMVFCYLSPWHMAELAKTSFATLKPGALVVSASFPWPGGAELARQTAKSIIDIPVYLYRC